MADKPQNIQEWLERMQAARGQAEAPASQAAMTLLGDAAKVLWQAATGDEAALAEARESLATLRKQSADAGVDPGDTVEGLADEVHRLFQGGGVAEAMQTAFTEVEAKAKDLPDGAQAVKDGLAGLAEGLAKFQMNGGFEKPEGEKE